MALLASSMLRKYEQNHDCCRLQKCQYGFTLIHACSVCLFFGSKAGHIPTFWLLLYHAYNTNGAAAAGLQVGCYKLYVSEKLTQPMSWFRCISNETEQWLVTLKHRPCDTVSGKIPTFQVGLSAADVSQGPNSLKGDNTVISLGILVYFYYNITIRNHQK